MATPTSKERKEAKVLYKGTDGEYVKIPEFDKLGNPHQGAAINQDRFEAGKSYYVSPLIAETLNAILDQYDEETFRLLMGKVNKRALQQLRGSANAAAFEAEQ